MSYVPLHHKYRPQTFAELVGQEAIATTLSNAIISQKIAPAYLFTGPRGTGKTSSARILAKSLNCLSSTQPTPKPCGHCEVCRAIARGSALDVIEIDAASNTGVDNIREIIERAQFAPVQCRYKVYVIDECHMLSTAAFNALLKTLEEPPQQVVFVLATTDPQRVLPTIVSRTQRFDYRRIPVAAMVDHLQKIAEQEKIDIDNEAIALVAQIANGGLRDAESLLDQLSLLTGRTTTQQVWDLVGAVPEQDLLVLLEAIATNNPEAVLEQCRHLLDRGREPLVVLQNLASFYLNLLIAKTAPTRNDLVAVTEPTWQKLLYQAQNWQLEEILHGQQHLKESETQLKNTTQPRLWLEITLVGLLSTPQNKAQTIPIQTPEFEPSPQNSLTANSNKSLEGVQPSQSQPDPTPTPTPSEPITEIQEESTVVPTTRSAISQEQIWQQMLATLQIPTTRALLEQHFHLISLQDSVARLGVKTKALYDMAYHNVAHIEAAFSKVCQDKIKVNLQIVTNTAQSSLTSIPKGSKGKIFASQEKPKPDLEPIPPQPQATFVESTTKTPPEKPVATNVLNGATNSKEDIQKAVESIAQFFNGEIVNLDTKLDSNADVATSTESSEEHNSLPDAPISTDQTIIRGRPDLTDLDEKDIPF